MWVWVWVWVWVWRAADVKRMLDIAETALKENAARLRLDVQARDPPPAPPELGELGKGG